MSSLVKFDSFPVRDTKTFSPTEKQKILVAISCIMLVGMFLSYALGSSLWYLSLLFFTLALVPGISIGRISETAKNRFLDLNIIK